MDTRFSWFGASAFALLVLQTWSARVSLAQGIRRLGALVAQTCLRCTCSMRVEANKTEMEQAMLRQQVRAELTEKRLYYCDHAMYVYTWIYVLGCVAFAIFAGLGGTLGDWSDLELVAMLGSGFVSILMCTVQSKPWHLIIIYVMRVGELCCFQFVCSTSWEYASFSTFTALCCVVWGCLQADLRIVVLGNAIVYGVRFFAMTAHYMAEPRALLSHDELQAMLSLFIYWETMYAIAVTCLTYVFHNLAVEFIKSRLGQREVCVELGAVKDCLEEISDGVVYLDNDLRIKGDSGKLAETLMTKSGEGASLARERILDYIDEADRQAFCDLISRPSPQAQAETKGTPRLILHLLDAMQVLVPFIVQHAKLHDGPIGQAHLVVFQQLGDHQKNAQSAGTAAAATNVDKQADVMGIAPTPSAFQVERGVDTGSEISASSAGSVSSASSSESEGSRPDVETVTSLSLEIVNEITHIGVKSYSLRFGAQTGNDANDITTWPDLRKGVPLDQWQCLEQWIKRSITRAFDGEEGSPPLLSPAFTLDLPPLLGQIKPGQMTISLVGGSPDDGDTPIKFRIHIADPKLSKQVKFKEKQTRENNEKQLRKALARASADARALS
eukprot:TRINITY_DN15791_c0_g1_i7.p1 TRINITY_DN15791_c0_g1~~TRINITY_DN15791_c0_g1_i7.p1  ORF type:complete len:612 (-),score=82.15 TRINITY_DN15791_c0_g1_i7:188-2023(-)